MLSIFFMFSIFLVPLGLDYALSGINWKRGGLPLSNYPLWHFLSTFQLLCFVPLINIRYEGETTALYKHMTFATLLNPVSTAVSDAIVDRDQLVADNPPPVATFPDQGTPRCPRPSLRA